jgi:hypothetical protein
MKGFFILLFYILVLTSCEKDINFDLKSADNVMVVDANIENDKPPIVVLTKSLNFFSAISPLILSNSFVHNATVTMSNGTLTHTLKEYTVPLDSGYSYSFYSLDPSSPATAFNGEFNKAYSLEIISDSKVYTANTTIPILAKKPDSLWWKPAPFATDTNNVILMVKSTDPPGLGNYVRYFTQKNSGPFLPGENSVFDDQIIDGKTYELQIQPGIDRNKKVSPDSNYFKRGDTVTLKLCNIDRATFTFWNTWEFAQSSVGNPFSQPNKIMGNISNGALGAFYGYASFYKTITIPK